MKRVCGQRDLRKTKLNNEKTPDYNNVNNCSSHILKKIKILTREFNDK